MTGDPKAENVAQEEWRVVKRPHNYNDGTKFRYAVEYTTKDGATVEIADWLTRESAYLVAAAPAMLAALKISVERPDGWPEKTSPGQLVALATKAAEAVTAAIAKATPPDETITRPSKRRLLSNHDTPQCG